MALATLDFELFTQGNQAQRERLGSALADSFKDHGFAKVINHGVPERVVEMLFSMSKRFFALSAEAKAKIVHEPGPDPQRGWSRKCAETTAKLRKENLNGGTGEDLKDEKEHFDCGPSDDYDYPNLWPDEDMPEFRPFMEQYFELCQKVSLQVMSALELGLHLPTGALVNRCIPAASELRLNHYPSVSIEKLNEGKTKRTWPHTDFGIITLLFQDSVGGLELEDRKEPGTFAPVLPAADGHPSELVINISDTCQRLTNDVIRAGVHRVSLPAEMKDRTEGILPERYSSVFFFKASRDTNVGPLPQFVTEDRPAVYKDMTALQFHKQMTKILY
ncbi:Major facilitator superfamily [Macrophomina phaseolina MS6]|uniref:Major facilitator superfamily n=1 Tax=Macrophomina phaseolina (strain MS6) TaxID=1126212 RepID=K2RPC0_MACPH|nr:Major facilitator superfamily [Macrophomina phaseolina MS6]